MGVVAIRESSPSNQTGTTVRANLETNRALASATQNKGDAARAACSVFAGEPNERGQLDSCSPRNPAGSSQSAVTSKTSTPSKRFKYYCQSLTLQ